MRASRPAKWGVAQLSHAQWNSDCTGEREVALHWVCLLCLPPVPSVPAVFALNSRACLPRNSELVLWGVPQQGLGDSWIGLHRQFCFFKINWPGTLIISEPSLPSVTQVSVRIARRWKSWQGFSLEFFLSQCYTVFLYYLYCIM